MRFYQLTFLTLLTGTAYSAIEDEVACVFNNFRRQNSLPPLKISTKLMQSSRQIAAASLRANQPLSVVPGDRSMADRVTRTGYRYTYVSTLAGQGYQTGRIFAEAMIQYSPNTIRNPNIKHFGFSKQNDFSNSDFGNTNNNNESVRDPIGC